MERFEIPDQTSVKDECLLEAITLSAMRGLRPTEYGMAIFEMWAHDGVCVDDAVRALTEYHCALEASEPSDFRSRPNRIGITDRVRLSDAVADLVTIRVAELEWGEAIGAEAQESAKAAIQRTAMR